MKRTFLSLLSAATCAFAILADVKAADLALTPIDLPLLGKVAPRSAHDIKASSWSIGGETLDRDFASYDHYKKYLGPLGAKAIRVQTGWAKIEQKKGAYEWAWLDAVVNDAISQGVQPWLEINYGNKLYEGGGGTGLGDGFPSSPAALEAWDRWALALVKRYKDRVNAWEIWNEPDLNKSGEAPAKAYTDLYLRTATMIRAEQPRSQIYALALASSIPYAEDFLVQMQARGKLDLIDAVTTHGYPRNPDETSSIDRLRAIISRVGGKIHVRQGETGAPSKYQENFALSKLPWSENTQAKWDLRRLLAHHAKDVPMNLFTLSDLHYSQGSNQGGADGELRMNYKGLLATNPDQTIAYAKPVYAAAQAVFTIFDSTVSHVVDHPAPAGQARRMAINAYEKPGPKAQVVALWFSDAVPVEDNSPTAMDVTLPGANYQEPVYVDLRTAQVYAIPAARWKQGTGSATFQQVPVYDSPVLIAEKSLVPVAVAKR